MGLFSAEQEKLAWGGPFTNWAHYQDMGTQDEYRRNAADAQREADRARNDLDRAAWLRVAQGWLSLLTTHLERPAQEAFDQSAADKGTRQDESKSSH
jgi:hypothetical protein